MNEKAAKEIALGKEIAKIRDEEANLLLRRHYLRQQDPMLRALTAKLQASYVCRDQRQQILHNEYKQLQNKVGFHIVCIIWYLVSDCFPQFNVLVRLFFIYIIIFVYIIIMHFFNGEKLHVYYLI